MSFDLRYIMGVSCVACALLAACGGSSDSYFPLNNGARWDYRVIQTLGTTESVSQLEIEVDGSVQVGEKRALIRRASTGHLWAVINDTDGIKRLATRRDVDDEFTADAEPRFVLKAPFAVGSTWSATTAPFLLTRRGEFPPELIHGHKASMTYTISSIGESVSTAAGTFSDCLRVEAVGVLRLYVDPVIGVADVPLTGQEWYCKGVGLVKLSRIEKIASPFLSGGEYTMELTRFAR